MALATRCCADQSWSGAHCRHSAASGTPSHTSSLARQTWKFRRPVRAQVLNRAKRAQGVVFTPARSTVGRGLPPASLLSGGPVGTDGQSALIHVVGIASGAICTPRPHAARDSGVLPYRPPCRLPRSARAPARLGPCAPDCDDVLLRAQRSKGSAIAAAHLGVAA